MIGKILLLVGSVIISLVVAELMAREVVYGSLTLQTKVTDEALFFQADPLIGWGHIPGFKGRFANPAEGYDAQVSIDRRGLRDNGNGLKDQLAGRPAILILGDSNTAGFEVADHATYPARLERMLFERGCPYRVVNGGVRGYGTDQAYWLLQKLRRSIDPELTIYMFTFNDLMDNRTIKRLRKVYGKPAYAYERDHLELIKPASLAFDRSYYAYVENHPDHYDLIEGRTQGALVEVGFFVKEHLALSNLVLPLYYQYFDPRVALESVDDDQTEMDLRVLSELLRMMKAQSRRFVLTEFPTAAHGFRLTAAMDLDALGIEHVDLRPYFAEPFDRYRWKTDGHWNELGHETAARGLVDELQESLCPAISRPEVAKKG